MGLGDDECPRREPATELVVRDSAARWFRGGEASRTVQLSGEGVSDVGGRTNG